MKQTSVKTKLLVRALDDVGDGTGNKNANVDGSVTPVPFKIHAPDSGFIVLTRMLVQIKDSGTLAADDYGGLATLTNGVEVCELDEFDNVERSLTDGQPVVSNADWGRLCYDVDLKTWGNGDSFILVRWTFANAGVQLKLEGVRRLGIIVNDNLAGLDAHVFTVQGYQYTP